MAFERIKGQDEPIAFLKRALGENALSHAYLFTGPAGVGKYTTALVFAGAIQCERPLRQEPCGECPACRKIAARNHPDVQVVSVGQGSETQVKIDQVREVIRSVHLKPFEARKKIVIIDGADAMTQEASNALLKVLEEPPQDSIFILIAQFGTNVLSTVTSRCQIVRFFPLPAALVADTLIKEHSLGASEARLLSFMTQGRFGEALRLMGSDFFEMRRRVFDSLAKDGVCIEYEDIEGLDSRQAQSLLEVVISWLRDVMVVYTGADTGSLFNADERSAIERYAGQSDFERIETLLVKAIESEEMLEEKVNAKLVVSVLAHALDAAGTAYNER